MIRRRPSFSLRSVLVSAIGLIAVLAVLVSASIIFLTSGLHRLTNDGTKVVESLRLAQEAEIALLLHARAQDRIVKHELEVSLVRFLDEVRPFATSAAEQRALSDVEAAVGVYFETSRNAGSVASEAMRAQDVAYTALESYVNLNVDTAKDLQRRAQAWDRAGNWIGIGVAAIVLLVAALTLPWLKRRAFGPIDALSDVMRRFGSGERQLRAQEEGPTEWREMSRRFNEMRAAITTQQQAQIAFLASVAHDIRTPLAVLKTAGFVLDSASPALTEPTLRDISQRIAKQVSQLERMANDFLDLSRIESGQLELSRDVCDVRTVISDVMLGFGTVAPERRIRLSLPPQPALAYVDQLRIGQVVTNLISNALKYSPSESPVEVTMELEPDLIEIAVRDYGRGIATSDREHVFEPFRRGDLSRESVPGVGLGLFIVRRIVEQHDGRIEVQSRLGAGSTFRVVLPRYSAPGD